MRVHCWTCVVFVACILIFASAASAQGPRDRQNETPSAAAPPSQQVTQKNAVRELSEPEEFVEKVNANTVTLISGIPSSTLMHMVYDMSVVLDDGEDMRILPVVGKGSAQNIRDLLYLRSIDMGIVQANILQHFEKTGEVGKNIGQRLRYIARFHNQEIHLLARPEIKTIQQLKSKRVNFVDDGSHSKITAQLLLEKLGITVEEFNIQIPDAFDAMTAGKIDAIFLSSGKPDDTFVKLKNDAGFAFLNIPYDDAVKDDFLPASFTHEDYPNIVPEGATVQTLAESTVLVSFNWGPNTSRYRRVANFTRAFFEKFGKLLENPRHPKWREVNLAAKLPGWERFPAAEEVLKALQARNTAQAGIKEDFDRFLTSTSPVGSSDQVSKERREKLFQDFLEWHAKRRTQ